jgi:phosphate transport system substrate-binding protein
MKPYLRQVVFVFVFLLFGGTVGLGYAAESRKEELKIAGTGASISTMKRMGEGFQKIYPNTIANILPSIGSSGGIKAVIEGKIDIGLSYRTLKPDERSADIIEEPYGRTAFIFGVQESNTTTGLTLKEIEAIYAGKRNAWADGSPIRLILRPLSDGMSAYLANINPGLKSASEKAHSIPGVFVGMTDQEAVTQVEKTLGSLGITSASVVMSEKRRVRPLAVDGAAPTLSNLSDGKYPYPMTLFLIYKKERYQGAVKAFVEYVFSREGQKLLLENGQVALPRMAGK